MCFLRRLVQRPDEYERVYDETVDEEVERWRDANNDDHDRFRTHADEAQIAARVEAERVAAVERAAANASMYAIPIGPEREPHHEDEDDNDDMHGPLRFGGFGPAVYTTCNGIDL